GLLPVLVPFVTGWCVVVRASRSADPTSLALSRCFGYCSDTRTKLLILSGISLQGSERAAAVAAESGVCTVHLAASRAVSAPPCSRRTRVALPGDQHNRQGRRCDQNCCP